MNTPIERLLVALTEHDCHPKRSGNGWLANCPAHDDRSPSLSVSEGDDRRALVNCHTGCTAEKVCKAIGLELSHLMPERFGPTSDRTKASGKRKSRIVTTYDYRDETGDLLFQVVRMEPKDFRQRQPNPHGGWNWSVKGVRVIPYRLPELLADPTQPIFIVEGEKDVDNLERIGILATCNAGGACKWTAKHAEYVRGRAVLLLADNDESGRKHEKLTAQSTFGVAATLRIVTLPGLPLKGDVSDWIEAGGTKDELFRLAEAAPAWIPEHDCIKDNDGENKSGIDEKPARKSQASVLLEITKDVELFRCADGVAHATVAVDGHYETWPLRQRAFRHFLAYRYYLKTENSPANQAIQDAIGVLTGRAMFDSPEHAIFTRLAPHGGKIYLDLADQKWRSVEVGMEGWKIVDKPAVKFRRAGAMLPLPIPEAGGRVDELREFVNVSDEDWPLVLSWLIAAFRPHGPYPVLCFNAEQGSGKSTTARVLRSLVDPNSAPLRSEPREPRDIMISAMNSWVICFDNLSRIPIWLSDALCRLATGGGFATRSLFTDADEQVFNAQRPIILNGIQELATRSDLLDRTLMISLPRITEDSRRTETEFWQRFSEAQPRIIGSLLDAVSIALRNFSSVKLSTMPRMADFATWIVAAESALGWESGTFLTAYTESRESANELALESSPVAAAIQKFVTDSWVGTAQQLLTGIAESTDDASLRRRERDKSFPRSPRAMAGELRRLVPNLRAIGLEVTFWRESGGQRCRMIGLTRTGTYGSVPTVPTATKRTVSRENNEKETVAQAGRNDHMRDDGEPGDSLHGTKGDGWDAKNQSQPNHRTPVSL